MQAHRLPLFALVLMAPTDEFFELRASDAAARDFFGQSVSVSDGTIVVGASRDNDGGPDAGSAYVFVSNGGGVVETKLSAGDGTDRDAFGYAVAIDADTLAVGAYADDHVDGSDADEGSVYVFVRSGPAWTQQAKLLASDPSPEDLFGFSVSVHADTVAVGTPYDDAFGADSGAVHIYSRVGTTWSHQAKITALDADPGDRFGTSLALRGDTLIVGAPREDQQANDAGAVYLFERTGPNWAQTQKLTASDGEASDLLGRSVALSGNTAVAGAFQDDSAGTDSGSAYVFRRTGSTWSLRTKLLPQDPASLASFGRSVAISGPRIVVGAFGRGDAGPASGAAYYFQNTGSAWSQGAKLVPTESEARDFFGASVSVSGNLAVIGAGWDDDDGINSGSAHLFLLPELPELDIQRQSDNEAQQHP